MDNKSEEKIIRQVVRGIYQIQKTRIGIGNRICAAFRSKMGLKPSQKEEEADKEALKILEDVRSCFKRLTDGLTTLPTLRNFRPYEGSIIDSYTELMLVKSYEDFLRTEEEQANRLEYALREYPIYTEFLKGVKGVGPMIAGVIISEIDISKATYASSLHKYAGLDVVITEEGIGEGRSRKKNHLVESVYKDKDGNEQLKLGISFNPFLKTKLVGVMAGCMIKCNSPYAQSYRDYKFRLQNMPEHKDKTDGHRHNMAMRYLVKLFLTDLYAKWRELEGLEVHPPYHESKLGIYHNKVKPEAA